MYFGSPAEMIRMVPVCCYSRRERRWRVTQRRKAFSPDFAQGLALPHSSPSCCLGCWEFTLRGCSSWGQRGTWWVTAALEAELYKENKLFRATLLCGARDSVTLSLCSWVCFSVWCPPDTPPPQVSPIRQKINSFAYLSPVFGNQNTNHQFDLSPAFGTWCTVCVGYGHGS